MLRVILSAGGTGGHVFPALAVAQELKKQVPDVEILFIGSRYGLEQHWVRSADIEFVGLPVQGLLGRGWRSVGAAFAMTVWRGAPGMTRSWWISSEIRIRSWAAQKSAT